MTTPGQIVDPVAYAQSKMRGFVIQPGMTDAQAQDMANQAITAKNIYQPLIDKYNNWQQAQTAYDGFVAAIAGLDKTYCAQQFNCTTDFVLQVLNTLIDRNKTKVANIKAIYDEASVNPVAGFTASATSIQTGGSVTFTDSSKGYPYAWSWNFVDGNSDTVQNPTHVFATAGTYPVTLTVTSPVGTDTTTVEITVTDPLPPAPVASFTSSVTTGTAPLAVTFTDTSTNSPTTWEWDFGDGTTGSANNVQHTFATAGTYTVTLTATNAGGSSTSTATITVS